MSGEKTEEPTPRKQRKAREDGDIPVSAALVQTAGLIAGIVVLPSASVAIVQRLVSIVRRGIAGHIPSPFEIVEQALIMAVPLTLAVAVGAMAVGFVQTGGLIAVKKLEPKLNNLNPVEGIKKLFKMDRLFQIARAFVAAILIAALGIDLFVDNANSVKNLVGQTELALGFAGSMAKQLLWLSAGVSLVLGAVDVLITRRSWLKRNRMSKDEVKREHKESEGDPQQKQERKRTHQEMLNSANLSAVKKASVIIVNPTHLATALTYDADADAAPTIVAQGEGYIAAQIIDAARDYGVPIVRDVPVARALHELEVGDEIPEALYEAIAEILREVWAQAENEANPNPPDEPAR